MRDRVRSRLANRPLNGNTHIHRVEIWPHTVRSRLCNRPLNNGSTRISQPNRDIKQ